MTGPKTTMAGFRCVLSVRLNTVIRSTGVSCPAQRLSVSAIPGSG